MSTPTYDQSSKPDLTELREAGREPEWQRMEARLLEALASRTATGPSIAAAGMVSPVTGRRWIDGSAWRWTAAAAGVVFAAALTFYSQPSRHGLALPKPAAPPPVKAPPTATESAPAPTPRPAPAAPARPRGRAVPTPVSLPVPPALRAPASHYDDFVALPGAFALPDFESGRIVRMELPLTVLPAYGIDLVPDAAAAPVEADFLIGQDGVARAIRLASARQ